MQRRPVTTTTTTTGGTTTSTTTGDDHVHLSSSSSRRTASSQRRIKKRQRLWMRKLFGTGTANRTSNSLLLQHQDDGPFFMIIGALGCGMALLILAVGYHMVQFLFSEKFAAIMAGRRSRRAGGRHHAHMHLHHNHPHPHGRHGDDNTDDNTNNNAADEDDDVLDPLPFHPIYRVPEAMETMGDRSAAYAQLRKEYDTKLLPLDYDRSLQFVQSVTHELPPSFLSMNRNGASNKNNSNNNNQQQQQHSYRFWSNSNPVHHSDQVAPDNDDEDEPMYDIHNCPYDPPVGYPRQWNLVNQVLKNWPADNTTIPTHSGIHQGLCQFDYRTEYDKALHYRTLEVPFVVVNDPRVARTAERWHQPGYVEQMVGPTVLHRTEYNTNNHFLYHMPRPDPRNRRLRNGRRGGRGGGEPDRSSPKNVLRDLQGRPAELQNKDAVPDALRMTFGEWLQKANVSDANTSPQQEHWYYRLIGCGSMGADGSCDKGSTEALYDELPFFQPLTASSSSDSGNPNATHPKSHSSPNALYLGDAAEQKGIHCRFGMKGVIAENHFDASRNAIALMMGRRRYILSHPNQCAHLALLPKQHESARHSAVDYTNPDVQRFPEFQHARGNEVVLQPGHVLYLPTNWFHYIVSLELNYQCNTRSGATQQYWPPIHECGF